VPSRKNKRVGSNHRSYPEGGGTMRTLNKWGQSLGVLLENLLGLLPVCIGLKKEALGGGTLR